MKSSDRYNAMFELECASHHQFEKILTKVIEKFFNVMAKNFVSETNSVTHSLKKRKPKENMIISAYTKIRKLQSET